MKKLVAFEDTPIGLDPRKRFGSAWVAAFLGVLLIIGAVFWAMGALLLPTEGRLLTP